MKSRTLRPTVHAVRGPWEATSETSEEPSASDPLPDLLRALRSRKGLIALDSVGGHPRRWSLIGFDPFDGFGDGVGSLRSLGALKERLGAVCLAGDAAQLPGPFAGGFLGALSYELGVQGEALDLPAATWPQPLIAGGLYRDWLVIEHGPAARVSLIVCIDSADGSAAEGQARARAEAYLRLLAPSDHDGLSGESERQVSPWKGLEAPGRRTVPRAEHCRRIEAARSWIELGEIYQANLSHRMTSAAPDDPIELYLRLRCTNPAPYMGFLAFEVDGTPHAILSSSPELLVELGEEDGERVARTRPIKGTIRRGLSPGEDAERRAELLASEKDLAELAMIVDLARNDLGRVAVPGGVDAGPFPELETYAAVHHLVADVRARIAEDQSAVDVVASLFPGGSITGAPKLRSMEVIAALEKEGRGFFTGSLGFIDARGHAALSILIRTMVHRAAVGSHGAECSFHVGGGITWRSDPGLEDDETLWKAAGMLRAFGEI